MLRIFFLSLNKLQLLLLMKKVISFFAFVVIPLFGFSQIAILNSNEIGKIKKGTTFFAMKDPASPKAAAYVEAIQKTGHFQK